MMSRTQRTQLNAFVQRKRRARRATRATSLELDVAAPVGFWFSPARDGLSVEQCRTANRLLRQRNQAQPIRGASKQAHFRRALRIAGIKSAVLGGRVGNSGWGRSMVATKGGNALRDHAPLHLQRIAPLGARAAQAAREGRKRLKAWEQRQRTPQTYTEWQRSLTEEPWAPEPRGPGRFIGVCSPEERYYVV
jgi:hypothetical protein